MKVINVGLPKEGYSYYEDGGLDEKEFEPALLAAYFYGSGGYEGTGYAIYQAADGKWDYLSLGHCSCNWPMSEDFHGKEGAHESLDSLVKTFSAELKRECQPLIDALEAELRGNPNA